MPQARPGDHHDGRPGQPREQVAHGVRLAGAGRAVEQHTALEVLAVREERCAVAVHAEDLRLDALQHAGREDQLLAVHHRALVEAQHRLMRAEHLAAEFQHVAAVDAELHGQAADLGGRLAGHGPVGAGDLQADVRLRAAILRAAQQDGQRRARILGAVAVVGAVDALDEVQTALHAAAGLLAGAAGLVAHGDAADRHGVRSGLVVEVCQAEHAVAEAGHPDQAVGGAVAGQPAVDGALDVDVFEARPGHGGHRVQRGVGAEMRGEEVGEPGGGVRGGVRVRGRVRAGSGGRWGYHR